jgi:hypothetical protein
MYISKWEKVEFEPTIIDLLSKSNKITDNKGDYWRFGGYLSKKIDGDTVIFCRLGRIKGNKIETIFDEAKRDFIPKYMNDERAIAYVNLVVYPRKEIIIFEDKSPLISLKQFMKIFNTIYKTYFGVISELKIELLKDKKVFERIAELEVINSVSLFLRPLNPDIDEECRKADELLKELNAENAKLTFRNSKGSLNAKNNLIDQGIHMGNAGYGDYEIIGKRKDGSYDKILSQEEISRTIVKSNDIPADLINKFFDRIRERLKRNSDDK